MLKKLLTTPLFYIFLLGFFLRVYHLGSLPPGFHVDEVKIGWNAYSLWKTGRDDWLHPFPVHYDTFGDQRPTGIFYAAVPALAVFGLNVFAVRFTSALFGSLAVIAVYFFTKELKIGKLKIENFAALMLALSPWHISLSRASSEGIIAVTLVLFGLVYLLKSLRTRKIFPLFISFLLLSVSYFFYHTSRILVPVFVLITLAYSFRENAGKIIFKPALLLFFLTLTLTLVFFLSPAARARLSQVSIFNDPGINFELQRLPFEEGPNHVFLTRALHNKIVIYMSRFFDEYTQYVSAGFLLTPGAAKPVRYQTASRGLLLYAEFFLLAVGLVAVARGKYSLLPFILLLAAPLPAAVTTEDAPNLHRALFMSPFISIIAACGLRYLIANYRKFSFLVLAVFCLDFFLYAHMYLIHTPARDEITLSRNAGADKLIYLLETIKSGYRQILLTNRPDNLYPWYAFLTGQNPRIFNQLAAANKNTEFNSDNITFSQYRCPSEYLSQNKLIGVLAVDTEGCDVRGNLKKLSEITRTSGGHPYTLWEYQPEFKSNAKQLTPLPPAE